MPSQMDWEKACSLALSRIKGDTKIQGSQHFDLENRCDQVKDIFWAIKKWIQNLPKMTGVCTRPDAVAASAYQAIWSPEPSISSFLFVVAIPPRKKPR